MRRNSRGLLESSVQWKSVLEIKNGPGWEWNFDDCHIIFRSSLVFYGQLPNPTTGSREAFRKAPREVDNKSVLCAAFPHRMCTKGDRVSFPESQDWRAAPWFGTAATCVESVGWAVSLSPESAPLTLNVTYFLIPGSRPVKPSASTHVSSLLVSQPELGAMNATAHSCSLGCLSLKTVWDLFLTTLILFII